MNRRSGDRAYVTARNNNALWAFDTDKLRSDPAHALIGSVAVGSAPVGLAVFENGKKIIATNSNRFSVGGDDRQSFTVVDPMKIGSNNNAVLGDIPTGAFFRELTVTADQGTLLVTNFRSKSLELINLPRMHLALRAR
jgi:DNA-binding beta-propeller fold protein YncE